MQLRAQLRAAVPDIAGRVDESVMPVGSDRALAMISITLPRKEACVTTRAEATFILAPTNLLRPQIPTLADEPWSTISEITVIANVCPHSVRAWVRDGCPILNLGDSVLFRFSAFLDWARMHLVRGKNDRLRYRRGTRPIAGTCVITAPTTATEVIITGDRGAEPADSTMLRLPPSPKIEVRIQYDEITLTAPIDMLRSQLPLPRRKRDRTTVDIAARFRKKPKTVLAWVRQDCPADYTGRGYLLCEQEVTEWLRSRYSPRRNHHASSEEAEGPNDTGNRTPP